MLELWQAWQNAQASHRQAHEEGEAMKQSKSVLAKCECCKVIAIRDDEHTYARSWSECGKSRWGKKHNAEGLAWWCGDCTAAKCDGDMARCGKRMGKGKR